LNPFAANQDAITEDGIEYGKSPVNEYPFNRPLPKLSTRNKSINDVLTTGGRDSMN